MLENDPSIDVRRIEANGKGKVEVRDDAKVNE